MAQGYYNGGGYNNGNYNNGGYYNQGYRYNRNYNGQYYNNRYYNNQNQNQNNNNNIQNNNNKKDNNNKGHKKGSNAPFYAIIAVLLLVATGCAGFLLIPMGRGNSNVNRTQEEDKDKDKDKDKDQAKKRTIGDDNFGYMEIPSTYTECGTNGDGTTLKYCSKNKKYTVTLKRFQNTNAYSLSRALLKALKDDGVSDSKVVQITIDGKEAYQLYVVTETDMTVLGLVIDDEQGISHYAGIIGPDGTNGIFGSLETYKLTN